MADDLSGTADAQQIAVASVLVQAACVVHHWHEFGPEADFDREIAILEEALSAWKRGWQEDSHG